jgi:hypothetical protein
LKLLNWRHFQKMWSLRREGFSVLRTYSQTETYISETASPTRVYILPSFIWLVYCSVQANETSDWLTGLLGIRDVPSSYLCQETGYPEWKFSYIPSFPAGCYGVKIRPDHFLPIILNYC